MANNCQKLSGQLHICTPEFGPKSDTLFCACSTNIKAFSILTGENTLDLDGHTDNITSLKVNPANVLQLFSSSLDGTLRVWDYSDQGLCLKTFHIRCPILHMDLAPSTIAPYYTRCFLVISNTGRGVRKKQNRKHRKKKKNAKEKTSPAKNAEEEEQGTNVENQVSLSQEMDPFLLVEYNLKTQKIVHILGRAKKRPIGMASLDTSGEGPQFVAMASPKFLTVVNADTGKRVNRRKAESGKEFTALAVSMRDGPGSRNTIIATGHKSGHLQLWHGLAEPNTQGKPGLVVSKHWHAHAVRCLQFGPEATYLLSGGEEAVLVLWQLATSKQDFLPRLGSTLSSISISKDQEYYAVTAKDNSVRLIRAVDRNTMWQLGGLCLSASSMGEDGLHDFSSAVHLVSDPSSGHAILNGKAGFLQFYDPWNDKLTRLLEVCRFNRVSRIEDDQEMKQPYVTQSAFSSKGELLVTVDQRPGGMETLQFWDLDPTAVGGYVVNTALEAPHSKEILAVNCHPAGVAAVTTSSDGAFKLWNRKARPGDKLALQDRSSHWVSTFELKYRDLPAGAAAFSPDGSILAVGYEDLVTLWDPQTAMLLCTLLIPVTRDSDAEGGAVGIKGLGFAPEAPHLVGWTRQCFVVWDLLKMEVLWAYTAKGVSAVSVAGPELLQRTGVEGLEILGNGVATMAACYKMKQAGQWCLLAFDTRSSTPLCHWRLPPNCQPSSVVFAVPPHQEKKARSSGEAGEETEEVGLEAGLVALTAQQEVYFLHVDEESQERAQKISHSGVGVLGKRAEQQFPTLSKGKRKRSTDDKAEVNRSEAVLEATSSSTKQGLDCLLAPSSLDLPSVSKIFEAFMSGHLQQPHHLDTTAAAKENLQKIEKEQPGFTNENNTQKGKPPKQQNSIVKPACSEELLKSFTDMFSEL